MQPEQSEHDHARGIESDADAHQCAEQEVCANRQPEAPARQFERRPARRQNAEIGSVAVDPLLLALMVGSAAFGAWLGAGVVATLP
jgi:hypothetical protein